MINPQAVAVRGVGYGPLAMATEGFLAEAIISRRGAGGKKGKKLIVLDGQKYLVTQAEEKELVRAYLERLRAKPEKTQVIALKQKAREEKIEKFVLPEVSPIEFASFDIETIDRELKKMLKSVHESEQRELRRLMRAQRAKMDIRRQEEEEILTLLLLDS